MFFCCILHHPILHLRLLCIANGVQVECKRSTVAMQMEYSWRAKVVHFKQKGRFLRGDKLHTSTTKAYNQLNINNISLHAQNSRISS